MRISVKLHGGVGRGSQPAAQRSFDILLPGAVTVGDLLRELANRFGEPFSDIIASDDARLPRNIRMFADGAPLIDCEQPLAPSGARSAGVTIILMSPIAGG